MQADVINKVPSFVHHTTREHNEHIVADIFVTERSRQRLWRVTYEPSLCQKVFPRFSSHLFNSRQRLPQAEALSALIFHLPQGAARHKVLVANVCGTCTWVGVAFIDPKWWINLSETVHKRRRSSSYLQQQCFMRHSHPTIRLKYHAIMKYACKPGTIYQSRFSSTVGWVDHREEREEHLVLCEARNTKRFSPRRSGRQKRANKRQ